MNSTYSVSEGKKSQWCISRDRKLLFSGLNPGSAINLARRLARADHNSTGRSVKVEFQDGVAPVTLACYGI